MGSSFPHEDRTGEAFLCADGTPNAQFWIGVGEAILVQFDRQVRATSTITTGNAQFRDGFRYLLEWAQFHEIQ